MNKDCTRCKVSKPLDLSNFPPHNKTKSGFDSWCRDCRNSYKRGKVGKKYTKFISEENLQFIKDETKECVICGSEEKLVIDHDHKTDKVRGMLCNHCNRGLGHFRDDPLLLEFAAQYLYASSDKREWTAYNKKYGEE